MPVTMVDPETARAWIESGEAVVVDVREDREFAQVRIPGATLVPLSRFDPADIPDHAGKKLLLHCASGVRCGHAAQFLAAAGEPEIYRLAGGIAAWIQAGMEVEQG